MAEMLCKSQKIWFFIGLNVGLNTNRLNHILAIIANNGGSIKEVQHDRILLTAFVYKVALICTIETRCDKHATLIHEKLEEKYKKDLTWHTVSAQYYGVPDPELLEQSSDPNIP